MKMRELLTTHLNEVKEGYWEHFKVALLVAIKLQVSSWAQLIHGALPFFKPPLGSDICSLINYLEERTPQNRKDCNEDTI